MSGTARWPFHTSSVGSRAQGASDTCWGSRRGTEAREEACSHHTCEKHLPVAKLAKPRFRVAGLFAPGPAAAEKVTVLMRTGRAGSGLSPRLGLQE